MLPMMFSLRDHVRQIWLEKLFEMVVSNIYDVLWMPHMPCYHMFFYMYTTCDSVCHAGTSGLPPPHALGQSPALWQCGPLMDPYGSLWAFV